MRLQCRCILIVFVASFSCLIATGQVLRTQSYQTTGHPLEAIETPDKNYVLVTVSKAHEDFGIDIFQRFGNNMDRVAFQPLGSAGARGIMLIPGTETLAVALGNDGVTFISLKDTLHGKALLHTLSQGDASGSGHLATTPDGRFLFVANEYGDGGNVGVIAIHRDQDGAIYPETVAHIPAARTTSGLIVSPDGLRLYIVSESTTPARAHDATGHNIPELMHDGCTQTSKNLVRYNGTMFVVDIPRVEALTKDSTTAQIQATITSIIDAGCSPVREQVSADESTLYLTSRGDNRLLIFDARKLQSDPDHAFLRSISSGGVAPVGLQLFNHDRYLLVSNSNRFADDKGNAVLFDLSNKSKPVLRQILPTGKFPRNISASPDGRTLYMTIYGENSLTVLHF